MAQAELTSEPKRPRRRVWRWVGLAVLLVVVGLGLYVANIARQVGPAARDLRVDAEQLESQLAGGDFEAAAATMGRLRVNADVVRSSTGGPILGLATYLPGVGDDIDAVRTIATAADEVLTAAQPLERVLPALSAQSMQQRDGAIDTEALAVTGRTVPDLYRAVSAASNSLDAVDTSGLAPDLARAVEQIREPLRAASDPLAAARTSLPLLPALLGADGPRTYFVMLQQSAEARGTGGIMGAYALIRADQGRISLVDTRPAGSLRNQPIPANVLPEDITKLWGRDLREWAGLNLSPHFPWTGQLVEAGWDRRASSPALDGVLAIDANVVSALVAGTGPVRANGVELTEQNAVELLSKDIYSRFDDPLRIDLTTGLLVAEVMDKVATGEVDIPAVLSAMRQPYAERRLLFWSTDEAEQQVVETMTLGGAIPSREGPFAMAVVNNGGGNKMDAYLRVRTAYEPGLCTGGVRIGTITVTARNTAPTRGLPDYVSVRSDLVQQDRPNPVVGSNRVLLDVYGPVAADLPLATVDGDQVAFLTTGTDRGHAVGRVVFEINPGQTRVIEVTVVASAPSTGDPPDSLTQPMVIPAETAVGPLSACE